MFKPVDGNPNFPQMENDLLARWQKDGTVEKYLHKNDKSDKIFSFQDGPITANNPMGVHHAWGRTYKDIWQKFFNLLGYRQRFRNGFDCQGLWVEVEVEKELKLRSKKEIENLVPGDKKASIAKFVQLCKDRVMKYSGIQTDQSKRLGYFMDWDRSYFTMSPENNYMIWHFLKTCHENGWIYKGHESVPWCPRCETAISQHEMLTEDYKEVVHDSIFFALPIKGRKNEFLLVWTTTPWTLPANIAVAVDEKMDYSLVEGKTGNFYWIAKELVETVLKKDYKKITKTVKGSELVGLKYEAAFDHLPAVKKVSDANPGKFHTVIATDPLIMPITTTEGTGMVHTAVSAGTEDFLLGKKLGLPMIPVINDDASYMGGLDEFSGKNAKKHPELIIDFLKTHESGKYFFGVLKYKHRYPACWRCKAELVWKVADEWYIAMDLPSRKATAGKADRRTLRQRMIEVTQKIKWMPDFGLDRELDWLKNMHDWLISKPNRYWGLALPIYECKKCGNFDVIGSREELKERAVGGWAQFEGKTPHKPYIDEVTIKCSKCGSETKRINDVGNPWLDAGIVEYSTITEDNGDKPLYLNNRKEWEKWVPVDFITESFPGQFKNWFYAQIAMSTVLEDINPFKAVLGFGTMFGEDGRPMHKSWGNYVDFHEGAEKIGVDVMRWLFARQNPADNLLFGYKKTDEVRRQFYLMLWNSYKYFVEYALLDNYQIKNKIEKIKKTDNKDKNMNLLDLWITERLNWLINYGEEKLRQYNAKDFAQEAEKFVSDLSTWYIRRSRDRLWTNSENRDDKESFYRTLYKILLDLAVILSPILPFATDAIYTNLSGGQTVHLAEWPDRKLKTDEALIGDMSLVREICETGHRVRKEQKLKVRQALKSVSLELPQNMKFSKQDNAGAYMNLIKAELNVKDVKITYGKVEAIAAGYDTELTPELIAEGKVRDLVRAIQEKRKALGKKPQDTITLTLTEEYRGDAESIKRKVLAEKVVFGPALNVE